MQTDSHMDVVRDWDVKMMLMWGRVHNEYGILTTYVHKMEQLSQGAENRKEVPHLCQVKLLGWLSVPFSCLLEGLPLKRNAARILLLELKSDSFGTTVRINTSTSRSLDLDPS